MVAQFIVYPFLHPKVGLLMPTSLTFKLVTVPLVMTVLAIHVKPLRKLCNSLLCMQIPEKFNWKDIEHIRRAAIVYGMMSMLTQLLVAPLLVPLPRPNPMMGKLTFLNATDVPRIAFTIATLLMIPRAVTNFGEDFFNIKDPTTSRLTSEIMLLGSFAGAVLLRDSSTPLDLAVPFVLTVLSFALKDFDKFSKFLFDAEFPPFKWTRDIMVLATVIYTTWFAAMMAYGNHLPVLKQFNETVRRMISGHPDTRFIGKLIEFGLLCLVPTVIRRHSRKEDKDVGFSSGFIVALLAKSMIPSLHNARPKSILKLV
jgi:hypothetical protein